VTEPVLNKEYRIALCSGEIRRWLYLGQDELSQVWWRDMETGMEFNESSLMYAWQIVTDGNDPSME
jgi:hypothetical protein